MNAGELVGGKYRLEEQVGRGGMASIWRATHVTLGRPVAIKFVDTGARDPAVVERFLREARDAAAIRHRNVIDIIDFGQTQDARPYMVMELLAGETLAERMDAEAQLPAADVCRLAVLTLSGLAAVHDAGIVHRDLKPENVFIVADADGEYPKLLDFGISRAVDPSSGANQKMTREGMVVGTPQYMSPEQARGLKDLDHRSDLYSMGVILYEALAGELPHDHENPGDLLISIVKSEPVHLSEHRPDLPAPLCDVVHRALTKSRRKRYQAAREMRDALVVAATAAGLDLVGQGAGSGLLALPATDRHSALVVPPAEDSRARPSRVTPRDRDVQDVMKLQQRSRGPIVVASFAAAAVLGALLSWLILGEPAVEPDPASARAPAPAPPPELPVVAMEAEAPAAAPAAPTAEPAVEPTAPDPITAMAAEPHDRARRPPRDRREARPATGKLIRAADF